jgi:hypothetical protein
MDYVLRQRGIYDNGLGNGQHRHEQRMGDDCLFGVGGFFFLFSLSLFFLIAAASTMSDDGIQAGASSCIMYAYKGWLGRHIGNSGLLGVRDDFGLGVAYLMGWQLASSLGIRTYRSLSKHSHNTFCCCAFQTRHLLRIWPLNPNEKATNSLPDRTTYDKKKPGWGSTPEQRGGGG